MEDDQPSRIAALRAGIDVMMRTLKIADKPGGRPPPIRLNPSDAEALLFIDQHPGCISADVGRHLGVVPTTMSAVLDRLTKAELIRRDRVEENRRVVILNPTDKGIALARAVIEERERHCAEMLSFLPEDQRDPFVSAVTKIGDGLTRRNDTGTE